MAAQEPEVASDLASQATAPSHVLDSESLLSQPSVIVEAEPEAEPDEPDDVFGDFETSDAPYVIPEFKEKPEPIKDADKKKWKSHNAQRKKEKKDLIPFEVWLQNKKDQEERKKKAKFVAMMGGAISASRRVAVPSLLQYDSWPSHFHESGFFFDIEAIRDAPRRHGQGLAREAASPAAHAGQGHSSLRQVHEDGRRLPGRVGRRRGRSSKGPVVARRSFRYLYNTR